jgi:hypothetical protein
MDVFSLLLAVSSFCLMRCVSWFGFVELQEEDEERRGEGVWDMRMSHE